MEDKKIKLIIGFITYGKSTAEKYLPYFLPSLTVDIADDADFKIIAFDNNEEADNENIRYIRSYYPQIETLREGGNLGFGRAYNKMIRRAKELGSEYFLALNPDMILEPGAVRKMVEVLDRDKELGSVCPKILRWDFENNQKTDVIDSCGIKLLSGLKFFDTGQGEIDKGQYDNAEVLGPSGAAAMFRMEALEKIKEGDDYFDELMFMYKEDCDLNYRFFLSGLKSKLISEAIIYHDRTASGRGDGNVQIALNRKNKSKQVKSWSFLSQHIIFIKYWERQSVKEKFEIIWYAFKMFIFAVLFEQYLLKEYLYLWRIRKKIIIYK